MYSARATLFFIRRHNESFAETLSYTFQYCKVIGYWVNVNYVVNKAVECRISFQVVMVGSESGKCNRKSNTENYFYLFHPVVPRWSCANKLNQAFNIFFLSAHQFFLFSSTKHQGFHCSISQVLSTHSIQTLRYLVPSFSRVPKPFKHLNFLVELTISLQQVCICFLICFSTNWGDLTKVREVILCFNYG